MCVAKLNSIHACIQTLTQTQSHTASCRNEFNYCPCCCLSFAVALAHGQQKNHWTLLQAFFIYACSCKCVCVFGMHLCDFYVCSLLHVRSLFACPLRSSALLLGSWGFGSDLIQHCRTFCAECVDCSCCTGIGFACSLWKCADKGVWIELKLYCNMFKQTRCLFLHLLNFMLIQKFIVMSSFALHLFIFPLPFVSLSLVSDLWTYINHYWFLICYLSTFFIWSYIFHL